jgi:cardiolipin synthase
LIVMCAVSVAGCVPLTPRFELRGAVPPASDGAAFDVALFQAAGVRLSSGNQWRLEPDGHVFDAVIDAIGGAERSVDMVSYIWHSGEPSDRIVAALERRARGVACRIVVDPLGSPDFARNVEPRLRAAGCESHMFRPLSKHLDAERDHRKITVVDGRVGFVGGFGIRQEWARAAGSRDPEWRDINLRVTGPVVQELQRAFAEDWLQVGGTLLPPSEFPVPAGGDGDARAAFVASSFGLVTNAERLTQLLVGAAHRRLWIWSAYFVPDAPLRRLLLRKRHEGVDVRLIVPGEKNDVPAARVGQRRSYGELRAGGVRIFEFQPTMMHAKTMLVDDRLAVIGSINLEPYSLTRLEEDGLVIEDTALVDALARAWNDDVARSREVP